MLIEVIAILFNAGGDESNVVGIGYYLNTGSGVGHVNIEENGWIELPPMVLLV